MPNRTFGVEEEFLLVEPDGRPRPLIERVLAGFDGEAEHELKQEQAETASTPHRELTALAADLAGRRSALAQAVRDTGGALCALASSPVPVDPTATRNERYERMLVAYGLVAEEQLTCGTHVHVGIDSRAEGVAAIDALQPWLPVLTALSANSPFVNGLDTGYASYRRMMWDRWPAAGPTQSFADEHEYDAAVHALTGAQVLLDEGMVYFDARLSRLYPTVEIRVTDVQQDADDAALLAALARGLVDTVLDESPVAVRAELLRGAAWRAAHSGMSGELVDLTAGQPVPAWTLVHRMVDRISPALKASGDLDAVEAGLERIHQRGTGADLQRASFARRQRLADVVQDAVALTAGGA